MSRMHFWGGTGRKYEAVNYLISDDHTIYAECQIPEGMNEAEVVDYGYVTMKTAILNEMKKKGMDAENIEWFYENDNDLGSEAFVKCNVYVDIQE